jgi:hypothetical protein
VVTVSRASWTVEPRRNGTWVVQRHGALRADSIHDTKSAAVARGVALCRRDRGVLLVKNLAGAIEDAGSYGNVPRRFRTPR